MRLESLWSILLRQDVEPELGLSFEFDCGAINVGVPLPVRAQSGEGWKVADAAVTTLGTREPLH